MNEATLDPTILSGLNSTYIADLYEKWLDDPNSIDSNWNNWFTDLKSNGSLNDIPTWAKGKVYSSEVPKAEIDSFSLSKEHSAHNFPGKLLGYMVEGKPLLGSVNFGNDVASIILDSKSGLVSFNGDDDQFLADALLLIENESLRKEMGLNAYALLRNTFSVDKAYHVISDSYLASQSKS